MDFLERCHAVFINRVMGLPLKVNTEVLSCGISNFQSHRKLQISPFLHPVFTANNAMMCILSIVMLPIYGINNFNRPISLL